MKQFSKHFLRGVFTLLPAGLTVVILFSFLHWTEDAAREVLPSHIYFPGLGLILGIVIIYAMGLFTAVPFARKIMTAFELPFKNVPIVKSIYSAFKSLSDYFSPEHKVERQVVVVRIPGFAAEFVGFVTRQNLNDLPKQVTKEDRVAVFVPLAYQIGGLTIFIPRSWTTTIDMKVDVAMRSSLTAWMPIRDQEGGELHSAQTHSPSTD